VKVLEKLVIDTIAVLDFGSQYAQLIVRRIREAQVYAELFPWDTPKDRVMAVKPKGFVLSGGPGSVYDANASEIPGYIFESGLPILGICYGMQALTHSLGGVVARAVKREYGSADLTLVKSSVLLRGDDDPQVWMSHGDRIDSLPEGFSVLAKTHNSPIAAMGDKRRAYYGLQFHPEVRHTPSGDLLIKRFIFDVCGIKPGWTPQSIIDESVGAIQAQVGSGKVLSAVSGGVDSSVATALVQKAVGDQLTAVFVETGLMRKNEGFWVEKVFGENLNCHFIKLDSKDVFFSNLKGVTAPEEKRRIIGETFIRLFESTTLTLGDPKFLVQGTIYPDVIESRAPERSSAHRIKTHHNVGGLPEKMNFELVEPLRYLFKDEVRKVGEALGLPKALVWRQPFPGPGLAVRCLGEVSLPRIEKLRQADAIFTQELAEANLLIFSEDDQGFETGTAQAFSVLLPVKAVGVMGDQRTYQEVVALRAVTTHDFMTADWARLPYALLARVSSRIVNEVQGINRVVYDITSKPPGTIEWE
jgi:GMP synthase (glutamine-hydrolysing)